MVYTFQATMFFQSGVYQGCQPPTSSNIENWWERDDKWCHNDHGTWHHLWKKLHKNCSIWPNWLTFHQPHYCLYYDGIPEFVRKCLMLTVKWLKQRKVFEKITLSESRFYKKWQTMPISARFQTLTWRPGETVQKLEWKIGRSSWGLHA